MRQHVCARVLTFAVLSAICQIMQMARDRKPKNVSLDPELVVRMEAWCKAQEFPVPFARALDKAMEEFLEKRGGGDD
jgi:hypothetical protein